MKLNSLFFTTTLANITFPLVLSSTYVGVFFCEFMPVKAMRFFTILRRYGFTTKHVLLMRNSFEMLWIHTVSNPAQMVDFCSLLYFTFKKFVTNAVSKVSFLLYLNLTVSPGFAANPKPASFSSINFLPEFFIRFFHLLQNKNVHKMSQGAA